MADNKQKYKEFCDQYPIPLFSQYYWLDAVCGEDNWDVLLAYQNAEIVASLPFYYTNNENGSIDILKAPLTQNNGIFFFYPNGIKESNLIEFENRASKIIIAEIEKMRIKNYRQYFHYNFTNWLPFYWKGYTQTTRYTYIIEPSDELKFTMSNFNTNTRKNIRKAEKIVQITSMNENISEFYKMVVETFKRQELEVPYSFETLKKLYDTLKPKKQCAIYQARDDENNLHSCVLYVWDETSMYYLISGSDTNYRNSQALTLLIWEGIKLANKLGLKFDFEGSMKENIEKFFRGFGPIQYSYFDIKKEFILSDFE